MPGYDLRGVTVVVYDIHAVIIPLTAKDACFKDKLNFLQDPQQYNKRYETNQIIQTDNFILQNLRKKTMKNQLFKGYANSFNLKTDYWKLQIPVSCVPYRLQLRLNIKDDIKKDIHIKIYLSPSGWSTAIIINLEGEYLNDYLVNFVGRLRGNVPPGIKKPEDLPFMIGTRPASLNSVFRYVQDLMAKEIYCIDIAHWQPIEFLKHYLISVTNYDGDEIGDDFDFDKDITLSDKALFLSILYGREIKPQDVPAHTNVKRVQISGPNFALTEFSYGTFLFLQREARHSDANVRNLKKIGCHNNNISDCLRLMSNFYECYMLSNRIKQPDSETGLHEAMKGNLERIRSGYLNQVCQQWFGDKAPYEKVIYQ